MSDKPRLVLVRDAGELRVGMALRFTHHRSRKKTWLTLLRPVSFKRGQIHGHPENSLDEEPCPAPRTWTTTMDDSDYCFCRSIPQGRLHRLADEAPDAELAYDERLAEELKEAGRVVLTAIGVDGTVQFGTAWPGRR